MKTSPAAKILVVDDEIAIRLTLEDMLTHDGHQVVTADSGEAALALISKQIFDLALLDLSLGDMTGTEVLAALRQQSPDTVAIMLTAHASLETAVEALRQGAHDYLFKPCSTMALRESIQRGLLKRQQAVQQRDILRHLKQSLSNNLEDIQVVLAEQTTMPPSAPGVEALDISLSDTRNEHQERFLQQDELTVDFLRHVITLDGHLLELSPTEFNLMAYLVSEAPRVISAQELIRAVQGYESKPWEASEIARAHIYHIRQKIKKATGRTNIIRTVRGVGYTIAVFAD
jgi:DNA-binding response OmpR family regulator